MYKITIDYALNGLVCTIGCQTVVFESIDGFLQELNKYLRDPRKTEVEWRKNQMFNTLSQEVAVAAPEMPLANRIRGDGFSLNPPPPPDFGECQSRPLSFHDNGSVNTVNVSSL